MTVTGRVKRMRIMGKMSFADLEDGTGTIQIVLRKDNLPEGVYEESVAQRRGPGRLCRRDGPAVCDQDQ